MQSKSTPSSARESTWFFQLDQTSLRALVTSLWWWYEAPLQHHPQQRLAKCLQGLAGTSPPWFSTDFFALLLPALTW